MKILKLAIIPALVSVLSSTQVYAAELLQVTQYHGNETNAQSGQIWLGLYPFGATYKIEPVRIIVTAIRDQLNEDGPKQKTGKVISVGSKVNPLILFRGMSELKTGFVPTAVVQTKRLRCGDKIALKTRKSSATLLVSGKESAGVLTNFLIILKQGGVNQQIYSEVELTLDGCPRLMWSGDIDGDGKIDLLLDTTNSENVNQPTLFLSSKAKRGQLLRRAARLTASGC